MKYTALVLLLAGVSLALPTPESEETEGNASRKILGSSVVTSVSVIMDVGNGSQTYFADAVGKPMTKPATGTQLASPINLLNPDRYEFYTFDDSGDLVKRLMTLDEIQGIIASGDGEASNYNSQSLTGDMPEKRVDDVVNNVQNVLKEEMEAHKTSPELKQPIFDTPDVTSTWNMILPAIFGNSGDDIVPDKFQNSATAETIMIEPTTLLPTLNDSTAQTETNRPLVTSTTTTEKLKQSTAAPTTLLDSTSESLIQESKTESIPDNTHAPIITVEILPNTTEQNITTHIQDDEAPISSKTEPPYFTDMQLTTENLKTTHPVLETQSNTIQATSSNVPNDIIKSTSSPTTYSETSPTALPVTTTNNLKTTVSSTITPLLSTIAKVTVNEVKSPSTLSSTTPASTPTLIELDTSSTTHFYKKTNAPRPFTQPQTTTNPPTTYKLSTPGGQLSTFFIIGDFKERPDSTTKAYLRPSPFTSATTKLTKTTMKQAEVTQEAETTTKSYSRLPSPFTLPNVETTKVNTVTNYFSKTTYPTTELYTTTTEENPAKEDIKGYLQELHDGLKIDSTQKPLSAQETTQTDFVPKLSTTDRIELTSTEEITTVTDSPYYTDKSTVQTSPENQIDLRLSTVDDTLNLPSTTEIVNENLDANALTVTEDEQSQDINETSEPQPTTLTAQTTEDATNAEKPAVTELLNQLLHTTDIHQINAELLSSETTLEANSPTTEKHFQTSTIYNEPTTLGLKLAENQTDTPADQVNITIQNATVKPQDGMPQTTDANLVSSIEQLISQAVGNLEEPIENTKESEKISQMMSNANSKPMSEVQVETATAASALIGTLNTESASEAALIDDEVNQAVDSLISQIIYQQPSQTTIEEYSTTESIETSTTEREIATTSGNNENAPTTTFIPNESTTTTFNNSDEGGNSIVDTTDDDRNRYEEIDLGGLDSWTTIKYEAKTEQPFLLNNYTGNEGFNQINVTENSENDISYNLTTEEPIRQTTTELNQEETQYTSTAYPETYSTKEPVTQDYTLSTQQYNNEVTLRPLSDAPAAPSLNLQIKQNISNSSIEDATVVTELSDIDSSTESFKDVTSKSNEIFNTEATELNQQNYNGTIENSSEPFLILAVASSEYPDYTSTEYVDSSTKSIEYDSTTSTEVTDSTETITELQTAAATQTELSTDEDLVGQTVSTTEALNLYTTLSINNNASFKPSTQPATVNNSLLTILSTEKLNSTNSLPSTTVPSTLIGAATNSQATQAFVNIATVTAAPKLDKPPELKLIQNISSSSTTPKPDMAWTLVSTVAPHRTTISDETNKTPVQPGPDSSVDLVPKPLQGFGLEDSTSALDTDVFQFAELCNELAFSFWSSVTSGISFARSVIVSPFAATSMLAMVFLGARGSTSGEMNEILKLDDMVTFNPHSIFKNVIESVEVSKKSGVATSVFVKELYSDKNKGKLLSFYKERVKQFYDGHVEEINFKEINDVIRRRTNLLVKRQTWGKIPEYLKDNNLFVRPPLAAVSANIFQTDCSDASTEGRDGELHFVVLPSIRQRKLIPIPAVVWRSGFLAGYDPGLDATAVAIGGKDQTISTIFVIPGQQGISAPGDGLVRLEARLIESAFRQGAWSRLLRSLIPRPGLEVQIPRFSHKSVINATSALQRMGLKDLFNSNTADLKGLNGVAHELYLSDIVQVNTFTTCGEGRIDETHHAEVYPATTNRSFRRIRKIQHYHTDKPFENSDLLEEPRDYQRAFHDPLYDPSHLALPLQLRPRQARLPEAPRLRFDRPFLYFVRHNPTGLILHMGRFNPRLLP